MLFLNNPTKLPVPNGATLRTNFHILAWIITIKYE